MDVRSLTRGPEDLEEIDESPFWTRLLLAPDRSASLVVLQIKDDEQASVVAEIDRTIDQHAEVGFVLNASGVPYVAEHIRQRLIDEIRRFSIAAFIAVAVLVGLLFRSAAVVVGSMVAALSASFATFLVRAAFGMRTDILAPNLWTIAFVLTISHVVYLTAHWQRHAGQGQVGDSVGAAIRFVGPVSLWSLAANLLGFASLLFVSAKPLRQFGISGLIAAVIAIVCAYLLYPPFLRAAHRTRGRAGKISLRLQSFFTTTHPRIALVIVITAVAVAPFATTPRLMRVAG